MKSVLGDRILELHDKSQIHEKHINKLRIEHENILEAREDDLNCFIRNQQSLLENAAKDKDTLEKGGIR